MKLSNLIVLTFSPIRTAEKVAEFIEPLKIMQEEHEEHDKAPDWVSKLTQSMGKNFSTPDRRAPRSSCEVILFRGIQPGTEECG